MTYPPLYPQPLADPALAPAQLSYTTNTFASPTFLGPLVTLMGLVASNGVHVLDNQTAQGIIVFLLGTAATWVLHYYFPGSTGKLGFAAPMPWNTPGNQPVAIGASVVTVGAPTEAAPVEPVKPLAAGLHTVDVLPAQNGSVPAKAIVTKV